MAKGNGKRKKDRVADDDEIVGDEENGGYKEALYELHVELVKLQRHIIANGDKLLVILEGRDAAGKDGTIKRIVEHLSPRESRVVALGKPTERELTQWYYQRWVEHLPAGQEFVCFNRSWYNRAGVERVMGFCTEEEVESFFTQVTFFEQMLAQSNIRLFKYYLDIDKDEQRRRLEDRRKDPLKQWKLSPIDDAALKHWDDYSRARDEMLARTHTPGAPWTIVRANDKKRARLNLIRDLLTRCDYEGKRQKVVLPDPNVVFLYGRAPVEDGLVAS
jgi:polyphosphate kinase 2